VAPNLSEDFAGRQSELLAFSGGKPIISSLSQAAIRFYQIHWHAPDGALRPFPQRAGTAEWAKISPTVAANPVSFSSEK
jgi:hypothetical protein